jgi:hypothetical protein
MKILSVAAKHKRLALSAGLIGASVLAAMHGHDAAAGISFAAGGGSMPLPYTGRVPNSLDDLQQYNPNLPNAIEAIWQPFYDMQSYPTAGQTQLLFFQVPQGQSSKTFSDTNMTLAGQFPAPTAFLTTAIQVLFMPGFANSASNALAAATPNANLNDVVKVADAGYLQLQIGSKIYLTDAPLGKFPPNFSVGGLQAYTGTFAAGVGVSSDFARAIGRYYEITPLLIPMNQNFSISLNWPTAVATTAIGRIAVILDGFYYRQSQ